jgi:hypothetical protein
MNEAFLEKSYPWIDWRKPLPVSVMETEAKGIGCRFCIAMHGMKGWEVHKLPQTETEFAEHMRTIHKREPDFSGPEATLI